MLNLTELQQALEALGITKLLKKRGNASIGGGLPGPKGDQGSAGIGIPANGLVDQILAKASGADYDTEWINPPTGGGVAIDDLIGNSPVENGILYSKDGLLANDLFTQDGGAYFDGAVPYTRFASTTVPGAFLNFIDATEFGVGTGMFLGMPDTDSIFMVGRQSDLAAYLRIISIAGVPQIYFGGNTNIAGTLDLNTHILSHLAAGSATHHAVNYGQVVLKSLIDAKGDLVVGTADNAIDRFPVGPDGYLLSADSGQATGLNWIPAPSGGGVSIGDAIGNSPVAGGLLYADQSGNLLNNDDMVYDDTNGRLSIRKNDQMYNDWIFAIKDYDGSNLVTFSTSNPTYLTDFIVTGPTGIYGLDFTVSAGATSGWNIGVGNDLFYFYGTLNSTTILAANDIGKLQLGAWNFAGIDAWVESYGGDPGIPAHSFRAADAQTAAISQWLLYDRSVVSEIDILGGYKINKVGGGFKIKEGTNATMGVATLVGGTVVVSTTAVTNNSRILLTIQGGTLTNLGVHYISARTAGTSFTISSVNILDASTVAWIIIEPS